VKLLELYKTLTLVKTSWAGIIHFTNSAHHPPTFHFVPKRTAKKTNLLLNLEKSTGLMQEF